jgi:nucleoside-diphosphate-sugar epimerase
MVKIMTDLEIEDIQAVATLKYSWDKLKNRTILISGGTGFIGQFVIEVIRFRNKNFNDNIKVISLSRHSLPSDSDVTYYVQDVTKEIKISQPVDYILHLASNTHPKQYASDPVGTITTNILGCNNLLNLAKEKQVKRFFLASSVEIYGECLNTPVKEDYCGAINCNTVRAGYNESKRLCESLCQAFKSQYGIDFVTARFSRCFGADRKEDSKALAQFIKSAVNDTDIVMKSAGKQCYSFCYVADAVSAMFKILLDGESGEVYNVAEKNEGKTLYNYASLISGFANKTVLFDCIGEKGASVVQNALLDTSKLQMLGWKPLYSVSEALNRTYKIYKARFNN